MSYSGCWRTYTRLYTYDTHIYIHTYMHTYTHTYIYAYMHIQAEPGNVIQRRKFDKSIHAYKEAIEYICTCIHTYIHTYMHIYTGKTWECRIEACANSINQYMHINRRLSTYVHACIHTYIHACMHAYIYRQNLGMSYRGLREFDKSIHAYKEALEYDPARADVHVNLGNSIHMHTYMNAVQMLTRIW